MKQFSSLSEKLHKTLSKELRHKEGIYFTPLKARTSIINKLKELKCMPETILEPSFGSGEFIKDVRKEWSLASITGVEYNKTIYDKVKTSKKNKHDEFLTLIHSDFLQFKSGNRYELIIGNPPYCVTTTKNKDCMTGRGNLYVLFIYKCLKEHLSEGGFLAFVIPTSFFNCSYYERCRQFIANNCRVVYLEQIDASFSGTNQPTAIMIIQNICAVDSKYIFRLNNKVFLSPVYNMLNDLVEGSTTLSKLGYSVKTGTIVWNQHKTKLVDDPENSHLLIYSSNIVNNTIVLHNLKGQKRQYIKDLKKTPEYGEKILVSRGYGNKYSFQYAVVDMDYYFVENHINIISRVTGDVSIQAIVRSFQSEKTANFIRYFFGNGSISKTELETMLPIYL